MTTQRVVDADVRAIFPTFAADRSFQPYIETASVIVTERLVGHYTALRLREIERWLAAWLASQSHQESQMTETRADEITIRYATQSGGTGAAFAQHLRLLDFLGLLQADQTATVARFSVH